jgi:ubiquitin-protein ligase
MVKSAPMIVVIFLLMFGKTEVAATLASTVKTVTFPILTAKDNNTHILLNETSMVPAKKMRKRKQNEANQTMKKVTVKRKKTNSSSASKRKCSIPKDTALPSKEQPKHSNKISLGGQEAATLRRIKREWKDAVKLGIAYDWIKMKDIANERDADAEYSYVRIGPYGSNLLRWHFSVMGTPNSEYDGGIYHGRVLLPKDYPGSPPRVQLLTPSGRFIPGHDICLSASNYHPESWTPKWTVLSLIDALRLHMLTQANEIGGMTATPSERRKLASASRSWAAGKLSHETMRNQGTFSGPGNAVTNSRDSTSYPRKNEDDDVDIAVQLAAIRATDSTQLAERLSSDGSVTVQMTRVAVEILKSPPRLAILILLTLFLVLNIN